MLNIFFFILWQIQATFFLRKTLTSLSLSKITLNSFSFLFFKNIFFGIHSGGKCSMLKTSRPNFSVCCLNLWSPGLAALNYHRFIPFPCLIYFNSTTLDFYNFGLESTDFPLNWVSIVWIHGVHSWSNSLIRLQYIFRWNQLTFDELLMVLWYFKLQPWLQFIESFHFGGYVLFTWNPCSIKLAELDLVFHVKFILFFCCSLD